jgi:protein-S-isoprenylcysteine O-methyltransferase Ste14
MPFKVAFILAFVTATAVATATARRAARRHGGAVNQLPNEVRGLLVVRAALGLVFYAALFAWLLDLRVGAWSQVPLPVTVRWWGVGLLVPVLLFFVWSFTTLGTNYRGGVGLYDAQQLVTAGPYRTIRHPIYAAFIAIMLLVFVVSANWGLGLSGLLLVVSIAAIRIPVEERQLSERFGAEWDAYRNRTGRLLPRWR